jgi:hypothetical protein
LVKTAKGMNITTEHLKTIFQTVAGAMESTTWDMYYGVLATQGKMTGTLEQNLTKAFSATPIQRFVTSLAFFKDVAKDFAGLGDAWPAFHPMFESLSRELPNLVAPLQKALSNLSTDQLNKLASTPQGFIDMLKESSNFSAEEIVAVQRTTAALENPMQTLVTIGYKILDQLSTFLTRMSGIAGLFGRKK